MQAETAGADEVDDAPEPRAECTGSAARFKVGKDGGNGNGFSVLKVPAGRRVLNDKVKPLIESLVRVVSLTSVRGSRIVDAFTCYLANHRPDLLPDLDVNGLARFAWVNGVADRQQTPRRVDEDVPTPLERCGFYEWWKAHEPDFRAFAPERLVPADWEEWKGAAKVFVDEDWKAYVRSMKTHLELTLPGKVETVLRSLALGHVDDPIAVGSGPLVLVRRFTKKAPKKKRKQGEEEPAPEFAFKDCTGLAVRKARNAVLGWDAGEASVHPLLLPAVRALRAMFVGAGVEKLGGVREQLVPPLVGVEHGLLRLLERVGVACAPKPRHGFAVVHETGRFSTVPRCKLARRHVTITNEGLFHLLWKAGEYRPNHLTKAEAYRAFVGDADVLGGQWRSTFDLRPPSKTVDFFREGGRGSFVRTDGVALSIGFRRRDGHVPWERRDEQCGKMAVTSRNHPGPAPGETVWAVDPGRVLLAQAVKVFPAPPPGQKHEKAALTRRQYYRDGDIVKTRCKENTARAGLADVYASVASAKVAAFEAKMAAVRSEGETLMATAGIALRRAAANYKLQRYVRTNSVLDGFVSSLGRGDDARVLYGAAKISATNRGEVVAPVMHVLRRFRRHFRDKMELVDEYGTTKHCSECLGVLQPMKRQEKRGAAANATPRLTTNRGLQRCTTCSGRLVSRDIDAALLIARCYFRRPACCRRSSGDDDDATG